MAALITYRVQDADESYMGKVELSHKIASQKEHLEMLKRVHEAVSAHQSWKMSMAHLVKSKRFLPHRASGFLPCFINLK